MPCQCARRLIKIITRRTPYVDAVSADEDARGVWILFHGLRHAILEVLLVGGVFDDRHLQSVEVGQGSLHATYANAFDHLDFVREVSRRLFHPLMIVNALNTLPPIMDVHSKYIV
jgi:hypothetical protein